MYLPGGAEAGRPPVLFALPVAFPFDALCVAASFSGIAAAVRVVLRTDSVTGPPGMADASGTPVLGEANNGCACFFPDKEKISAELGVLSGLLAAFGAAPKCSTLDSPEALLWRVDESAPRLGATSMSASFSHHC